MSYYFEENQWGERYLPDVNRDTFADRQSNDVYQRELDLDFSPKDTLHVIIGSDSGLILPYVQHNLTALGSCAIVIELDDVAPYVRDEYAELLTPATSGKTPPTTALFQASDWQNQDLLTAYNPWFLKRSVVIHQSHCCYTDHNHQYTRLLRNSKFSISEYQVGLTQRLGVQHFIEVQLKNAADNVGPFIGSSDFGVGKVAIVLAGGPSLAEHIDWVLDNRESLFIIAVSRLCKKLADLNLKPDLVVSVDPLDYMYEISKQGVRWSDVPLINSYHLTPELLQQWQGPHYYIGDRLPWDQFNNSSLTNLRVTGPTVSHTGVIVASYLGFSTILLAGADFCFSSLGGTHVDGTPEAALRSLPSGYEAQVTTYSGRVSGTNLPLLRSIDPMCKLGETINKDTLTLYNLSSEAACIDSIPLIDKHDIVLKEPKPIFDASAPYKPSENTLRLLGRELQDARRAFNDILALSKKALVCVDYIYECNGRQATPAHHKRLDNLELKLTKLKHYTKTIKHYNSVEFVKLKTPSGFQAMSAVEMEQWARTYYGLLKDGAIKFSSFVDSAQRKVALRKSELMKNTCITDLIAQWAADNTPARVLAFEAEAQTRGDTGTSTGTGTDADTDTDTDTGIDTSTSTSTSTSTGTGTGTNKDTNTNTKLAEQNGTNTNTNTNNIGTDQQIIVEAAQRYRNSLSVADQQAVRVFTDTQTVINNCINSVMFLFDNENLAELTSLSEAISKDGWPNNALTSFIEGLIHELQSDKGTAAFFYQSSIDSCSDAIDLQESDMRTAGKIIETALIRVTQCNLAENNGEHAELSLAMLSQITPHYTCTYAKLLDMLGQPEKAIEQIEIYLQKCPADWRAVQQLSEHYRGLGAVESADLAEQLAADTRSANLNTIQQAA